MAGPKGDNHPVMRFASVIWASLVCLAIPRAESSKLPLAESLSPPAGPPAPAAPAAVKIKDTLDRKKVQEEYSEGNFENVIQLLEQYRSRHARFRSSDSLFMAKYLGVVYASNPATKEKGKYWLYRMLQFDPSALLVDMYVGDEVDRVFQKVRSEFIVRRNYRGINDMKLAKALREEEAPPHKDTVVLRDTVRVKERAVPVLTPEELLALRKGWTWNLNLGLGMKFLDKSNWANTAQHTEFRFAFDFRQRRWPINIALDYMHSMSKNVYQWSDAESRSVRKQQTSDEINVGVRKIFDRKLLSMRPFVGGGFGYISTNLDYIVDLNEGNIGLWLNGGTYWELDRHFNVGTEFLWSTAKVPVGLREANAGGWHVEMLIGYHW